MFKKMMSFIFSVDEEDEEVVVDEPLVQQPIYEPELKVVQPRREELVEEPSEKRNVFIDLEGKEKPQTTAKTEANNYRAYRRSEPTPRVPKEVERGTEYVPQPIISPIFGTSNQKIISEKDEQLNNFQEVVNRPSTGNIISPMFGVKRSERVAAQKAQTNNQEATIPFIQNKPIKVPTPEKIKSKINDIMLEDLLVDTDTTSKTQQFKLFDLSEEGAQVKAAILSEIDSQLSQQTNEVPQVEDFYLEDNDRVDDTRVFHNLKAEVEQAMDLE